MENFQCPGLRRRDGRIEFFKKVGKAGGEAAGEGVLGPELFAEQDGELAQFVAKAFFGLGGGGGVPHELVPDLDDHFPRDGDDGDVALAFAR